MKRERATFAMGCFWKPQKLFDSINGVIKTEVGYMGGDEKNYPNPSYEQVCSNKTGYAEVVQIIFDSKKVGYEQLLKIFWENHNPTQANRQGVDIRSQYRSVVFYYNNGQKTIAEKSKKNIQKNFDRPITTEIVKSSTFYKAEEYHQKYLDKRDFC